MMREIVFYLEGKEVGRSEVKEGSTMSDRHEIAKKLALSDFDDFSFVDNSVERLKASEVTGMWNKDSRILDGTLANHERESYLAYKNKFGY